MSINAILAAGYVTHSPAGDHLKVSTIATLKALAFCTGARSNACYPSIQTLREMTGCSENTVRAALKELEALGFITRTARIGASNIYSLQIDAMRAVHRRRRWGNTYEAGDPYTTAGDAVTTVEEVDDSERTPAPVPAPVPAVAQQTELIPAPAKKKTKKSDTTPALDEAFNAFYKNAYPRRMEPLKARRAFEKAVKNGADPRDIIEGARRFAAATASKGKTYIPYPASWLNAGGWMNEAGDIAPAEPTPWQKKTARLVQSMQAAAVVNNVPALTAAPATAPAAPLAIEPGYI